MSIALSQHLTALRKAKEAKAALSEKLKAVEAEYENAKRNVIQAMEEQGVEKTSDKFATFSIRRSEVPTVTDWDKFYQFIARRKAYFLLQRRVSVEAWREMRESLQKKDVPGTEVFEKIDLGITTLKPVA